MLLSSTLRRSFDKPQMFDSALSPDQAYLFDAIASELALRMLQDSLFGIEGKAHAVQLAVRLPRLTPTRQGARTVLPYRPDSRRP